jgi:folylpolyglutamate synthase
MHDTTAVTGLTVQKSFAEKWQELDSSSGTTTTTIKVLPSVPDALEYVRALEHKSEDGKEVHALITGSLHLVGRALGVLEGVDAL